ncbi:MAG: response regulator, partial [Defluviitaleaceae bacterium]|nr:response regulator [Defluviitaleaceae bacterium]
VFSEYSRLNAEVNRTKEGAGLGLNITKQLVQMMGGEISFLSEYEHGSTFCVQLRQGIADASPIGRDVASNLRSFEYNSSKINEGNKIVYEHMPYGRVLIVDDVEVNLYVAKGLLAPYGLQIETADSGFETIELVEQGKTYDIIFMDYMMPEMDGIEATRKLRNMDYSAPIVALTANALIGNREMFVQNGFDGYVAKPINPWQLNAAVNKFIYDKYPEEAKKYKNQSASDKRPKSTVTPKLLEVFQRDAEKALVALKETMANLDLKLFTTTVHAMKSALAIIGEIEASAQAARIENAAIDGNLDLERDKEMEIMPFVRKMEFVLSKLHHAKSANENEDETNSNITQDTVHISAQLRAFVTHCEDYDDIAAYAVLDELRARELNKQTRDAIEEIRDILFLSSDFELAAGRATELADTM